MSVTLTSTGILLSGSFPWECLNGKGELGMTGPGGRDSHSSDPLFLGPSFHIRVSTLCAAALQISLGRFKTERCLLACALALLMSERFWSQCSPSASEFSKKLLSNSCCEEGVKILIQVNRTSFTFIFPYPNLRVVCSWHMCF